MEEIFKLMKCFSGSFINSFGEVIINRKGNVYFAISDGMTREEIASKIFEWCSRSCAKGQPYQSEKRNNMFYILR